MTTVGGLYGYADMFGSGSGLVPAELGHFSCNDPLSTFVTSNVLSLCCFTGPLPTLVFITCNIG